MGVGLIAPSSLVGATGTWLIILAGVAGTVAWIMGAGRKSVAETQGVAQVAQASAINAQASEITALRQRMETLEGEVAACRQRDEEKAQALRALTGQIRGSKQLADALRSLARIEAALTGLGVLKETQP